MQQQPISVGFKEWMSIRNISRKVTIREPNAIDPSEYVVARPKADIVGCLDFE